MNSSFANADITSDDKLWALLAWLLSPIVPIIILLMEDKKNRPFLKYHSINALAWGIVVIMVLGTITLGCISVLGLIGSIYFAIKAYQGEWVSVPVLTDFMKNQGWLS